MMTSKEQIGHVSQPVDCDAPCYDVALAVMRGIPDPIILVNANTAEILYINAAAEVMLGRNCTEMRGQPIFVIHPPTGNRLYEQLFQKAAQLEICDVNDAAVVNASGQITHYDIRITPLFPGDRCMLLGTFRDVTDRRQAEREVRDAEHRFKSAIEHSPMGLHLYRIDEKGAMVFTGANASADRILGVSNSMFVGKTLEEAFPPLAGTEVPDQYRRIALAGGFWRSEQVDYADEQMRGAYEVIAFQVKPGETGVMFWDITDRRKSEAEMRRLMAAIHAMDGSVVITDAKGLIQYVNPCFERLSGYTLAELKGIHIGSIKSGVQDRAFYERMWHVLSEGESWAGTLVNKRKDGTLYHEKVIISSVKNAEGIIVNYVAVKRDITHELDLEKRVMRSQKMAALGQFAHRVAHDMTNALAVILGSAEVLAQKEQDATSQKLLGDIQTHVARVSGLASSLMLFASPSQMQIRRQRMDRCIAGMQEIIARACHPNIMVRYDLAPDLYVEMDPDYFQQAVMHIVVNATEAIETHGSLQIRCMRGVMPSSVSLYGVLAEAKEVPAVVVEIADNGAGMTEDACAQAFEPFFSTKRDQRRNAGLGLATVYSIISQFHGDVYITSTPGQGTTVHISIPLVA